MKITKILICTSNPGKLDELLFGLKELIDQKIELVSLKDFKIKGEPEETGKTYSENSFIKAKFYGDNLGLPVIGDDGGLGIDILNGQPGVKSRRWPGYSASDEELITYCLKKLESVPMNKRNAALYVNLCFYNPINKDTFFIEEKTVGRIALSSSRKRIRGYPFRALFFIDKYQKYYDELTEAEHLDINHRLRAAKKMARKIISSL